MPSIFVKDDLRASIEAATGGKVTVLYTQTGQPCFMNVIPRFNLEDIDPALGIGAHPAFIVGGAEKSEIFIATYLAVSKNGELLSLPGVDPTAALSFDAAVTRARANGDGWHLITNAEWSALALWCWKNGFQPRGNTQYGRSSDAPLETARRVDGLPAGDTTATLARTLTGSGPLSWRHDNTNGGIADLCGNIWEWTPGLRVVDGEVQIIPNNDAALASTDLSKTSTAWRAISAANGALVAPGTVGTLKYDAMKSGEAGGVVKLSTTVANRNGTVGDDSSSAGVAGGSFQAMPIAEGLNVPAIARALGIAPIATSGLGFDSIYVLRNYGERMANRGGSWGTGTGSGVFSLHVGNSRVATSAAVGARVAFVL